MVTSHPGTKVRGQLPMYPPPSDDNLTHPGMYCLNGTTPGVDDPSTNEAVNPLFQVRELWETLDSTYTIPKQLSRQDWWFHHVNQVCGVSIGLADVDVLSTV